MGLLKNRKLYVSGLLILLIGAAGVFLVRGSHQGGNILAGASPDTSALQMYYFDGEKVAARTLYDSGREKELIKRINKVLVEEADESALRDLEVPFYGIWIGNTDGYDISVAWSDGIWLKNDGTVYQGDGDFASWWAELENEDEDTMTVLNFPNAARLAEYHILFMEEEEKEVPDSAGGVSMAVERISASEIVVTITNDSEEEFVYGEYYSLQKKTDGNWYTMPVWADNIGFPDIANILPAGGSVTKSYDYQIFGPLKPGEYKLVVEDMGVEFAVVD